MTEAFAALAAAVLGSADGVRVLAEIHATVELERALAELGVDPAAARAAAVDPLIGARVVILADRGLVVAEPSVDARLAATLARTGEGFAGRYVAIDGEPGFAGARERAAAAGHDVSREADGPFGREILVLAGRIGSPSLLIVEPRSVLSRP